MGIIFRNFFIIDLHAVASQKQLSYNSIFVLFFQVSLGSSFLIVLRYSVGVQSMYFLNILL